MVDEITNGFCNERLKLFSGLKEGLIKNKQLNLAKLKNALKEDDSLVSAANNESDDVENKIANDLRNSNNQTSIKINMPLVEKGDAGYIPDMDLDQDGTITYEEFKQYCDEKQISIQDRIKLMQLMETSKMLKEKEEDDAKTEEEKKKEELKQNQQVQNGVESQGKEESKLEESKLEESKLEESKMEGSNSCGFIDSNLKQAIDNYVNNKVHENSSIIETEA